MIRFSCLECNKGIRASDRWAGRTVHCPRCGKKQVVPPPVRRPVTPQHTEPGLAAPPLLLPAPPAPPASEASTMVDCPRCKSPFLIPNSSLGRWVNCLSCGMGFAAVIQKVPSSPPASRPLPPPVVIREDPMMSPIAYPIFFRIGWSLGGVVFGCLLGRQSAQSFPVFGGILMLSDPGSQARETLVPGHMLLWAVILGIAGLGIGYVMDRFCGPLQLSPQADGHPVCGPRSPARKASFLPTIVAVASLLSAFLLFISANMASAMRRDDDWLRGTRSPGAISHDSALRFGNSRDRLDARLGGWGTSSTGLFGGLLCFSLFLSYALTTGSLALWSRHTLPGRIFTILAVCVCLPSTCCALL